MSDQGFNFAAPPPRRERKEFEPPPWEKDRFDELPKRWEQREAVVAEPIETGAQKVPIPEPAAEPPATETETGIELRPMSGPVDESRVAAMLFELKAEDPPVSRSFNRVGLAAGLLLLGLGVMLVIWATVMIVVASRRPEQGRAGVLVGLTVMIFGAGFAGTGIWFVFRSLRQQGVL